MALLAKIGIVVVLLLPFLIRIVWNILEKDSFNGLAGPLNKLPR
jgi:hypothetical protein